MKPIICRDYIDAPPEIEALAKSIIKKHKLVEASGAKIKYVFKYTNRSVIGSEFGYINKAIGHWQHLAGVDFIITLWANWWAEATPEAQEANLYHQLLHIAINPKRGIYFVQKHAIECFPEELIKYGAWNPLLEPILKIKKKK